MPIRPNQTSCTCCIIPLLLAVVSLIAGMIYAGKALTTWSSPETAAVTAPRSTDWQKAMSKRCLLGDASACDAVKATRPDVR